MQKSYPIAPINIFLHFDSQQIVSLTISPVLNKVGLFSAITELRNVIGQTTASLNIEEVMDQGKILICNLSKGRLGEDAATILGSTIVNAIQLAALNRASIEERERRPFYLYVDEMHSFISLSIADILAEARKYKLSLFLAHQYTEQIHEKIRFAIFGNVGTMIIFRVGADDAKYLAQEVDPHFSEEDLINLPRYSMYLKLMIDGATSRPFSAETIPLLNRKNSLKDRVIAYSQKSYSSPKHLAEQEIYNGFADNKNSPKTEQSSLFE